MLARHKVYLAASPSLFCSLVLTILRFKTLNITLKKVEKAIQNYIFRIGKHDFHVFAIAQESVSRCVMMILISTFFSRRKISIF